MWRLVAVGRGRGGILRRPQDTMHPVTAGKPFQFDVVALIELEISRTFGHRLEHRRHQDLARVRLRRDAGGHDHALAEEVAAFGDSFAGMEPDAHPNRLAGMLDGIIAYRALDADGAQ